MFQITLFISCSTKRQNNYKRSNILYKSYVLLKLDSAQMRQRHSLALIYYQLQLYSIYFVVF